MDVIIYHNPACGTSRNALELIRHVGIEPHIVEYLKTPPSRTMVAWLAKRAGKPLRDLLRGREDFWTDGGMWSWAIENLNWCFKSLQLDNS